VAIQSRFWRALLAFLALPGVISYALPLWIGIGRSPAAVPASEFDRPSMWAPFAGFNPIGIVLIVAGTALLLWCVREFHTAGKGTLAPWDPPRHLVVSGPYRRSRNPMYVAAALVLLGWTVGFGSGALLLYTLIVLVAFLLRVRFYEEPYNARAHRVEWERYRGRVPRWIFPNRKALILTVAALAVAAPLAGFVYEAYEDGRTRRAFEPPGMLVDIGGRKLHLLCIGDGSPIVFFEASGFGVSSLASAMVRERLASRTRVCSYDRIGMGWSDPAPSHLTAGGLASDLAVLQDRADLPAPFVIVASSIGGLVAEMFARQYPERVAGLVFLDAATGHIAREGFARYPAVGPGAAIVSFAAQLGGMRLLDPFDITGDSDEARRSRGFTYGGRAIGAVAAIARGVPDTVREFDAAPPLRADVPLVVLSASDPRAVNLPGLRRLSAERSDLRLEAHQRLAKQSTRGSWKVVPKSEHLIAFSQPEAVIEVIVAMLDELR
jgi:pimeloyl-ACP methyl ester carboxylesterase/protein-S-isoprenylcysteine O-methyltransferase Ste14